MGNAQSDILEHSPRKRVAMKTNTCILHRNNGNVFVDAKGRQVDNHWIVPHNMYFIAKYNAHINVEIFSLISSVKYLYKYVCKGHDRATTVLESRNKIKQYLDVWYVSTSKAVWRLFTFKLHDDFSSITRLQVHLPNEQRVVFHENVGIAQVLDIERHRKTTIMEYFEINKVNPKVREISYADFPNSFTRNNRVKKWAKRHEGVAVRRLYFVNPAMGERYFLQTLLTVVKGATSFEDLRTVNGRVYQTFKVIAIARGLYDFDDEWDLCLQEASKMQTRAQLRALFVTILTHSNPANPRGLWIAYKESICNDCVSILKRRGFENPDEEHAESSALSFVADILAQFGKTLNDFNLPHATIPFDDLEGN
jgi:hypothetical protein